MKLIFRSVLLIFLCHMGSSTKLFSYLNNYNSYGNGYQMGNQYTTYGMYRNNMGMNAYNTNREWPPQIPLSTQLVNNTPPTGVNGIPIPPSPPGTMNNFSNQSILPNSGNAAFSIPGTVNIANMGAIPNIGVTGNLGTPPPFNQNPSMPTFSSVPNTGFTANVGSSFNPNFMTSNTGILAGNSNVGNLGMVVNSSNPGIITTLTPTSTTNPSAMPNASNDDGFYKDVTYYVLKIAEQYNTSSTKKNNGILPDGALKHNKEAALKQREDRTIWNPILSMPTQLYKNCIYPSSKVNYTKFCKNSYLGVPDKLSSCLHSFCQVCCDHLGFIFESAASSFIGESLKLKEQQGINGMKQLINNVTIDSCKSECKVISFNIECLPSKYANISTTTFKRSTTRKN
jgi:hypothetical protein